MSEPRAEYFAVLREGLHGLTAPTESLPPREESRVLHTAVVHEATDELPNNNRRVAVLSRMQGWQVGTYHPDARLGWVVNGYPMTKVVRWMELPQ